MVGEHADMGTARADAERMMQLGQPVTCATVRALLAELHDADAEIVRVREDRDRWQEAYCEARLEARRRAG